MRAMLFILAFCFQAISSNGQGCKDKEGYPGYCYGFAWSKNCGKNYWTAKEYCPSTCYPLLKDKSNKCAEYVKEGRCEDRNYMLWMATNCAKSCLKCCTGDLTKIDPKYECNGPPVTPPEANSTRQGCRDKEGYRRWCYEYAWSKNCGMNYWTTKEYCPKTCNPILKDKSKKCAKYVKEGRCEDRNYMLWMATNCAKSCLKC